jgi:argininosuccinate synthase
VSGGLSSLALTCHLHEAGHAVQAFEADLGQGDEQNLKTFAESVRRGGIPVHEVDLRAAMGTLALDIVSFQGRYDGGYWNTTGAARAVLVEGLASAMHGAGCAVMATGCVNGGNDHRRFERYARDLVPGLGVFAPWSDPGVCEALPDRAAMARQIKRAGIGLLPGNSVEHSTDGNLAGVSHEDAGLEDLRNSAVGISRLMGVRPTEAPDRVREVMIGIENGRPISLDDERLGAAELIQASNGVAGSYGLGLTDVVENRVNGTKCRGVYEAPGMELLSHAVVAAHQVSTDRPTARLFAELSQAFAAGMYEGTLYRAVAQSARADLTRLCASVDAVVRLDLYKGAVISRSFERFGNHDTGIVMQRRFGGGGQSWISHEARERFPIAKEDGNAQT